MSQEVYDKFSEEILPEIIRTLNAPFINETEKALINELNPKKVLDIGCGDGIRLFNFLKESKIEFKGIEKFEKLFQDSPYKSDIIHGDIAEIEDFIKVDFQPDLITILGGSLNGIFGLERQELAWKNVADKLQNGNYVIMDHLVVDNFDIAAEIGVINLFPDRLPPQFFLSLKQLEKIWTNNGLELIKSADIRIPAPYLLRYFVLKKV